MDPYLLIFGLFIGSYMMGRAFIEAYGCPDYDNKPYKKIETAKYNKKKHTRLIQEQAKSKMPYRYYKIYNATRGEYAYNLSGGDNYFKVWNDNGWDNHDALVGFYTENSTNHHNVIYCRPGYAVYVQAEEDKENEVIEGRGALPIQIPPAILINLNNAFDYDIMYSKLFPRTETNKSDSDSDSDEESDSREESASEIMSEDTSESASEIMSEDNSDEEESIGIKAECPDNQSIIEMLQNTAEEETNQYRLKAFDTAIKEIQEISIPLTISILKKECYPTCDGLKYWSIGKRMRQRISKFLLEH